MLKIRDILRLSAFPNLSNREIGLSCQCSHNTVKFVVTTAEKEGITYLSSKDLSDDELKEIFYPTKLNKQLRPEPNVTYLNAELRRPGVTMKLLHEEYLLEHPNGLGYTQFCERIRGHFDVRNVTLHIERKAGEKLFVDWAGDTIKIINRHTGEVNSAYLFVASLGVSSYPYIEASLNKTLEKFLSCHINAFKHYGAVPLILVPDNDKAAVTTAARYDPTLNQSYQEMAEHYGIAVIPARTRRPRDKGSVEKTVLDLAVRTVIARTRNMTFFNLEDLNHVIQKELANFVVKPYQKNHTETRKSRYFNEDLPAMRSLPKTHYIYASFHQCSVHIDYHIEVEKQRYSVPYIYAKKKVMVRLTVSTVEISYQNQRIALHTRLNGRNNRFSTQVEHMPDTHKKYSQLNKTYFINWAANISPEAESVIKSLFTNLTIEEQGYRQCLGIKRLCITYGKKAFKSACQQLIKNKPVSYRMIKEYLENVKENDTQEEIPIKHPNIRGKSYYTGEGVN